MSTAPPLPSGVVAVVKRDCPTCLLVAPVLAELAKRVELTVYSQDDPGFPEGIEVRDDRSLEISWHHKIDAVPTLLRVVDGREQERALGWHRGEWEKLTGVDGLGSGIPDYRPGCGALTVAPEPATARARRYGGAGVHARRGGLAPGEDETEALFDRGWTDGLPVVPPTERRVLAMLGGTSRSPDEVVAVVPPDLVECTVEKVAINAVLAGCRPARPPAPTSSTCTGFSPPRWARGR